MNARQRGIEILLKVLSSPNTYSARRLAEHFQIDVSQIKKDFKFIRATGIVVEQEKRSPYRYTILPQKGFKELQYLQHLSDAERGRIKDAFYRQFGEKDALYISNKLESLYDFQQLGLRALRRPVLDRIDHLMAAQKNKKRVTLKNYRSNSGQLKDRKVEPFYIDVELNTLQAFDLEKEEVRHYLLPRIERVIVSDENWQFAHHLKPDSIDVFRIAKNEQVWIHLKLKTQAYNYLVEQYPKALSDIHPASEANTWDFETQVNINFYGLTNFILANAEHIQIFYPQELKDHIRQKAKAILEDLE